ncbi:MAG TPA: hypothetical protein VG319_00515, partial [Polyangia bacterium]|nr:hypothetical protein [Polyangia bacterium]
MYNTIKLGRSAGIRAALKIGASFLAGVALLAVSSQAHAVAVLEQSSSASGTTSAAPAWSTQAVTAGHLLVAVVQWQTTTASNGVVTAPAGWALAAASSHNFGTSSANIVNANIYYYENGPARAKNATEIFSVSSSTGLVVHLAEVAGIVDSGSLDVTGTQ